MSFLPQRWHATWGSVYRAGVPSDELEACLDRVSLTVGSGVERGKAGGDSEGGVVL